MIRNDPKLSSLKLIQAPLVDMEIRGVPALKFLGGIVYGNKQPLGRISCNPTNPASEKQEILTSNCQKHEIG
ncbi:hypothetical protein SCA6_000563 [Theobroma cacao]